MKYSMHKVLNNIYFSKSDLCFTLLVTEGNTINLEVITGHHMKGAQHTTA